MILIVSHAADEHAAEVLRHLERQQASVLLFDTGTFPRDIRLNIGHATGAASTVTATVNGSLYNLQEVRSVWWRRPLPFGLDANITGAEDQNFAYSECHAAVTGLWSCLDAVWINEPVHDEVAARKAYQLKLAAALGMRVPKTLVTNDPALAAAFIDAEGEKGTIYKAFSATEKAWRETRLLRAEERQLLASVQFAPVIFQEYIRADIDLRITVIGGEIFPAAIHSGQTSYQVDFRMTMHQALICSHVLPDEVMEQLRGLMKALGLVYGAIDMRLTPDGEYVFLEVNPAGQWLFIQERTQQPITEALVSELLKYDDH